MLVANGINPEQKANEVIWSNHPPEVLGKALREGLVDAIATSGPDRHRADGISSGLRDASPISAVG